MTQNYKTRHAFKRMFFAPLEAPAETDSLFSRGFGKDILGLNAMAFKGILCVYFVGKTIRNHLVKP